MLRIFPGVCHPPEGARRLLIPCVVSGFAAAVCGLLGCSTHSLNLAEQSARPKENTTSLVSSTSLSSAPAASVATAANAPSDSAPLNVSRLQKPDGDSPKPAAGRSTLDLATYQTPPPSRGEVAARVRATVNGTPILDEEVREAIYPYLMATQNLPEPERSQRRKDVFEKELKQLIEREIILQDMFAKLKDKKPVLDKLKEAASKEFDKKLNETRKTVKFKTDEEVKAFFRMQGLTLEGVRRQVERNFMAMEYMRNRIFPSIQRIGPEQIREYYDGHPEEFQVADGVTWQDIFLDASRYSNREAARQFAAQLIARARAGEDFRQLVTQYDQGNSSYLNGEGYGHHRGEIKPPEAEPILFQMREGDMKLVELTNGFHVVRLVKREHAGLKPFDEKTQTAISNKLQGQAWEREYQRILRELKRKASIEISANPQ
ncbi:MAG TPA: peptidyl-prolyl cis-trans isomerase [Gemmataceae bacterium]|nr:peptidyl-prolyl cis-trans isomerase [Gemmataceae bacterium]